MKDRTGLNSSNWKGGIRIKDGYVVILSPINPRENKGYVKKAVLMAEKAIGHILPTWVIVHHVDGDKQNDSNGNLVICQDQSYHLLISRRKIALDICGHATFKKCAYCHKYDDPTNMFFSKHYSGYHKECKNRYESERLKTLKAH